MLFKYARRSLNKQLINSSRDIRCYYEQNKNKAKDIIIEGSKKANEIGNKKMEHLKSAMRISL